ncbi:MAG: amidohydrolase family protein [Verrucomicrobia bacterium]|nr:amidohydrolase family protein [Verrucomicrobiota bacterium]
MSELDRLPWFETNPFGQLQLKSGAGVPPVLDIHSHVGWSYGFARPVDYRARNELIYFYDYEVDQDVLGEDRHPSPIEQPQLAREFNSSLYNLSSRSATHTAANFAAEMDRFNVKHACLLPIEGPIMSRHAEDTMQASALDARFIPFAAVFPWPWGRRKIERLKNLLSRGAKAVKVHPEFQFIAADHPHQLKLFEWCAENAVPVLAHCGYTSAEPAWMRAKAEPERFRVALRSFPKLQLLLAHTGLSKRVETLAVARDFPKQVWLDISGQSVPDLKMILDGFDRDRICFGSDWPFYPLVVALARTLVATEDCPGYWTDLLFNNGARFLRLNNEVE